MKILISAAETSSDAHGAELLRALRTRADPSTPIDAFGIGGPKLRAAGLRIAVDARELLSMGFLEVLVRLPRILGALTKIISAVKAENPDVAVVIDYPDFHFLLARRLKRLGIPVVYYIPPKVWAWRKGRIRALREYFARVICILPFEEVFYKKEGVPVTYVGNPLVDELPVKLTREEARKGMALSPDDRVVLLMPGSRPAELRHHLEVMLDAAVRAAARLRAGKELGPEEKLKILIPLPATANVNVIRERVDSWLHSASGGQATLAGMANFILDLRISTGNAPECMAAADSGLIKSGTSTLEAGLMGCPHAVVFRPNLITIWIFRLLIRYRGAVGLVNLVAGTPAPYLTREILCEKVTVKNLAQELFELMTDRSRIDKMKAGFQELRKKVFFSSTSPSLLAASEILQVAQGDTLNMASGKDA